jgi:putative phosphoribosyl transferase
MPKNSHSKILFADRVDAADQLIASMPIAELKTREVVVIAISEGAVVIADRVARALEAPMDILLSEPVMAPNNAELPIAMVTETQALVMNQAWIDGFEIDEDYVYGQAQRNYEDQVLSYVYRYRHGTPMRSVENRVAILVDECVETGITTLAAIKSMIDGGAKNVYIAVPVLDTAVYANLIPVCDGVYCPHRIRDYVSIEYYYDTLEKPTFETIERILSSHE